MLVNTRVTINGRVVSSPLTRVMGTLKSSMTSPSGSPQGKILFRHGESRPRAKPDHSVYRGPPGLERIAIVQDVADRPHGVDQALLAALLQRLADAADGHLDDVRVSQEVVAPHVFEELAAG